MCKSKSMVSAIAALGASLWLALLPNTAAVGQSTLFNVPSTDVVSKQKVYLEFDFLSHFETHADGGFQIYAPRAVFGVGKGVEVGVNVSVVDAFAPDQPVYISPNVKWQFYNNEKAGVAISAGGLLYTPIAHRAGADTYGFVYSVVSKKVKSDYGPRLTGGGYALPGLANGAGTQGGAIVGYEQPLSKRVTFVTDWFSGRNAFGYVTPGFSFALPKSSLLNVGYSIGNRGPGNNALFVYYGITF
ncbi:MAG TPA: hypothetical protein VGJ55_14430 [Pyrinomonadaceae bacterium]